ncbi:MAG: hypothetical protein R3B47_04330 [Bacteroidia bacterium]
MSFDGGKMCVRSNLNGEGWDATVNIMFPEKRGNSASGGRTYGVTQCYEVNPGTYDVLIKCLKINGSETEKLIQGVVVTSNDTIQVTHDFSGWNRADWSVGPKRPHGRNRQYCRSGNR